MTKSNDAEMEGTTAFPSAPAASYRYVISLKSEKMNIWLEDRHSKKQWQTGFLGKEDYVTAANVFVDATAADYVSCFKQCLDCALEEKEEAQRELTPLKGGMLHLELSLKIRLLRSSRTIQYSFELQPVAVERIDILESKLKDQQEELDRLRAQVGTGGNVFLYVESNAWVSSTLQWKETNSEYFTLSEDKTSIVVLQAGLYAVGVVVNHVPSAATGVIMLKSNGVDIQSVATGSARYQNANYGVGTVLAGHQTSSSLMAIVQVEKDAQLSVNCAGTSAIANVASYLTAARIGAWLHSGCSGKKPMASCIS